MSAARLELDTNQSGSVPSSSEELRNPESETILFDLTAGLIATKELEISSLEQKSAIDHQVTREYLQDRELFHFSREISAQYNTTPSVIQPPFTQDIRRYIDDENRIAQLRKELQQIVNPETQQPQSKVNEYYKYGRDGKVKYGLNGVPEVSVISIEHDGNSYLVDVYDSGEYVDLPQGIYGKVWFVSGTTRDSERNPMGEINLAGYQKGERVIFGQYSNELDREQSIGDRSLVLLDSYDIRQSGHSAKGLPAD